MDTATQRSRIRLLGETVVETAEGAPVSDFTSPRLAGLLTYLILHRDAPQDRARIAFSLWPDSTESQARTNLRHLLHTLRNVLPDCDGCLEVTNRALRWKPDAPVDADVVAFEDLLARADDADDPDTTAEILAMAVQRYGGGLLPGCWDEWVLPERDRLARSAVAALTALVDHARAAGDDAEVIRHGTRLLELDHLSEQAYAAVISAHARRGERATALRLYDHCATTLRDELDIDPGPAVTEAVRTDEVSTRKPIPSTDEPFVGRHTELDVAAGTWNDVIAGHTRVLLVEGEPGIGKSRLLTELCREWSAAGAAIARTRCYERGGRAPWHPIIDLLRSAAIAPRVTDLDPVWRTELSRIVPELETGPGPSPPIGEIDYRRRLFDAAARAMSGTAQPLVLVVDDLQWCDADSFDLLSFIVGSGRVTSLLLAGTVRPMEIDDAHAANAFCSEAARAGALETIALGRLDAAETRELARELTGAPLEDATADRLFAETEGNPLFVVESVRAGLDETGRSGAIPPSIHAVISSRLALVSDAGRQVAETAATIGRQFDPSLLADTCDIGEDTLVEALDELWQRGIVRDNVHGYDFSHDRVREVVRRSISPARNRKLNRAVADALATAHAHDPGPVAGRLAAHYEAAGLPNKAIEMLAVAADYAYRVYAIDDALASLRYALALVAEMPPSKGRESIELDLRAHVGVPLVAREGYGSETVVENYERALLLARRLGRQPSASVLRGVGLMSINRCDFERAAAAGSDLTALAATDPAAGVEGLYVLGVTAFWRGRLAEAEKHLSKAIDAYRPDLADDHLTRFAQDPRAVCMSRLALTHWFRGDLDAAEHAMRDALDHATAIDHPMTIGYVRGYEAMIAALSGDDAALTRVVDELTSVTHTSRLGFFVQHGDLVAAWNSVRAGDASRTADMADVVEHMRHDQQLHLTFALYCLACAALQVGDAERGRALVAEADAWTKAHEQRYLEPELLRLDGLLLEALGDPVAAEAAFRSAVDTANAQGACMIELRSLCDLARLSGDPNVSAALGELRERVESDIESADLATADSLLSTI